MKQFARLPVPSSRPASAACCSSFQPQAREPRAPRSRCSRTTRARGEPAVRAGPAAAAGRHGHQGRVELVAHRAGTVFAPPAAPTSTRPIRRAYPAGNWRVYDTIVRDAASTGHRGQLRARRPGPDLGHRAGRPPGRPAPLQLGAVAERLRRLRARGRQALQRHVPARVAPPPRCPGSASGRSGTSPTSASSLPRRACPAT